MIIIIIIIIVIIISITITIATNAYWPYLTKLWGMSYVAKLRDLVKEEATVRERRQS